MPAYPASFGVESQRNETVNSGARGPWFPTNEAGNVPGIPATASDAVTAPHQGCAINQAANRWAVSRSPGGV
ncbi:MAG: hypothetical protein FI706_00560 [SAR202 cluster bacterium]|nr:hypothetical protein [SAR202 cluster bacterium]